MNEIEQFFKKDFLKTLISLVILSFITLTVLIIYGLITYGNLFSPWVTSLNYVKEKIGIEHIVSSSAITKIFQLATVDTDNSLTTTVIEATLTIKNNTNYNQKSIEELINLPPMEYALTNNPEKVNLIGNKKGSEYLNIIIKEIEPKGHYTIKIKFLEPLHFSSIYLLTQKYGWSDMEVFQILLGPENLVK